MVEECTEPLVDQDLNRGSHEGAQGRSRNPPAGAAKFAPEKFPLGHADNRQVSRSCAGVTIGPAPSGAIPSPRRLARSRAVNATTSTPRIPCAIAFSPTQASQRRHLRTGGELIAGSKGRLAADISTFVHRRYWMGSICLCLD